MLIAAYINSLQICLSGCDTEDLEEGGRCPLKLSFGQGDFHPKGVLT